MKLDKYIATSGYASRRKALILIEEKRVKVNGKLANVFTPVKESDQVSVDGNLLNIKASTPTFIVYNKPKGIICTSEKIQDNIIDTIKHPQQIYPIGRLDKDSEGLILLTNQSLLIDQIANPKGKHEKEYLVTLNLPVRTKFLEEISKGIKIGKEQTQACEAILEPGTKRVMRITITQGLNRQIRKMCNAYQYQVIKLQRVRVMNIKLGNLKLGEWRDLNAEELKGLMAQLENEKAPSKVIEKQQEPKPSINTSHQNILPNNTKALSEPKSPPLAPKRLKKHEIKSKQKEPWKKMHHAKAKKAPAANANAVLIKKQKPQRKKKDKRVPKPFKKHDDGE